MASVNYRGAAETELSPADRATQTARRKAIYLELHPETAQHVAGGKGNGTTDNLSAAPSFAASTADATGKDERTVRRDAERGEKVCEDALNLVRGTALDAGTYLDKPAIPVPHSREDRPNSWVKRRAHMFSTERRAFRRQNIGAKAGMYFGYSGFLVCIFASSADV